MRIRRGKMKAVIFGGVLAGLLGIVLLAVCEWAIRVTHPEWEHPRLRLSSEIVHDPELGWKGEPGFDGPVGTYRLPIRINRDGFRDEDWGEKMDRSAQEGRDRILFIGDSLLYGYRIPAEERITEQARDLFMRAGRPVETFNAGMPGYGTGQEFRAMQRLVPYIRPHTVVVWFCTNDIGDAALPYDHRLRHRVYKPFYDLNGDLVLHERVPVRFSHRVHETWLGNLETCYFIDWILYRIEDFVHVHEVHLWNSDLLETRPSLTRAEKDHMIVNLGWMGQHPALRPYYEINKQRNLALWKKMKDLCESNDARMVMLFDERDQSGATQELMSEVRDLGIETIAYGEQYDPVRPWGGVWGDGHPNFIQNYVAALTLTDALRGTTTPLDFDQAPWVGALPSVLDMRRPHNRNVLFGEWGRYEGAGRTAGADARCVLHRTARSTGDLTVTGHGLQPLSTDEVPVRLWIGSRLRAETLCRGTEPFELRAELDPTDPEILFLRIDAGEHVFVEIIATHAETAATRTAAANLLPSP